MSEVPLFNIITTIFLVVNIIVINELRPKAGSCQLICESVLNNVEIRLLHCVQILYDRLERLSAEGEYSSLHTIRKSITSNVSQDSLSAGVNVALYPETIGVPARTVGVCCFRDFGSKV